MELPPLPPLSDEDFEVGRSRPWRLSDVLADLDAADEQALEAERSPEAEQSLLRDVLDRRAALSKARVHRRRYGAPNAPPVVASFRDPERRGWLFVALVLAGVLALVIVQGVFSGLNRPVRPEYLQTRADSSAANAYEDQAGAVGVRDVTVLRDVLPIALGTIWLVGAWVIDHEARRALMIRGVWRNQPTVAYRIIALVVVTPILVAGLVQIAWGVVSVLVQLGRSGDAMVVWRGVAWLVGSVVAIVVLRLPTAAGVRWLVRTASGARNQDRSDPFAPRRREGVAKMVEEARATSTRAGSRA